MARPQGPRRAHRDDQGALRRLHHDHAEPFRRADQRSGAGGGAGGRAARQDRGRSTSGAAARRRRAQPRACRRHGSRGEGRHAAAAIRYRRVSGCPDARPGASREKLRTAAPARRIPVMMLAAILWLLAASAPADPGGTRMTTTTAAPRIHVRPEDAVQAYFDGRDHGSTKTIRTALHPDCPLQSVAPDGTPRVLEQIEWWERLEKGVTPPQHNEQKQLDREGGMALVEATSRWTTLEFRDLLILADTPAGWWIVGKVFTRIPAGDSLPAPTAADETAIR